MPTKPPQKAKPKEIQLRDAKAHLSAVVDEAVAGRPSLITRHGKPEVVVVSFEEWERLSKAPTFAQLLMAAPEGIKAVRRRGGPMRKTDF